MIVVGSLAPTLLGPAALARRGALAFLPEDELAVTDLAQWLRG
jgi:hypothetical protein